MPHSTMPQPCANKGPTAVSQSLGAVGPAEGGRRPSSSIVSTVILGCHRFCLAPLKLGAVRRTGSADFACPSATVFGPRN